jgi:hypothetical protein
MFKQLGLAALLALCAPLLSASRPPPHDRPPAEPWEVRLAPEGQVDLGYRIGRADTGHWLNSVDLHGAFRLHVVTSARHSHGIGVQGGVGQWFGIRPAPRRYLAGGHWGFFVRGAQGYGYWRQPETPTLLAQRPGRYPWCVGAEFDASAVIGLEYSCTEALAADTRARDGLRLSVEARVGAWFMSLEAGGAMTSNFDRLTPFDAEGWFRLGIARPWMPLSGHIGYAYHSTWRFKTHFFTVGLRMLF